MSAEVIHLATRRDDLSPLDKTLAAIRRHPNLQDRDKAAAEALSRYTTDIGFFQLDWRERRAVTKLTKSKEATTLKRLKATGLLHAARWGDLFRFGTKPTDAELSRARPLFDLLGELRSLELTLHDTWTYDYELAWLVPKVAYYARPWRRPSPEYLAKQLSELYRLGYLVGLNLFVGEGGKSMVRYSANMSYELSRPPDPLSIPPGDGAA